VSESSARLHELLGLNRDLPIVEQRKEIIRDLLLFEYGGATFALAAQQVEEVIAWRPPLPLPRTDARVMGILQDRGRIIAILENRISSVSETPLRVIICRTPRGYLGLPAGRTRCADSIKVYGDLAPNAVIDTSEGLFTFLDPVQLAASQ
jgi:hypothetical protein